MILVSISVGMSSIFGPNVNFYCFFGMIIEMCVLVVFDFHFGVREISQIFPIVYILGGGKQKHKMIINYSSLHTQTIAYRM